MRHAKSDWRNNLVDMDRPLSKRGRRDAQRMGIFLKNNALIPDQVLVSSVRRTQETLKFLNKSWSLKPEQVVTDRKLYLADEEILLEIASTCADADKRIMVLAHNPGMDYAVNRISAEKPALTESGKLMTTAAIAHFKVEDRRHLEQAEKCRLIGLYRPKEIRQAVEICSGERDKAKTAEKAQFPQSKLNKCK